MTLIDCTPYMVQLGRRVRKSTFPLGDYIYIKKDNKQYNHCWYHHSDTNKEELADGKYTHLMLSNDWEVI